MCSRMMNWCPVVSTISGCGYGFFYLLLSRVRLLQHVVLALLVNPGEWAREVGGERGREGQRRKETLNVILTKSVRVGESEILGRNRQ